MHASALFVTIFSLYISITVTYPTTEIVYQTDIPKKCCNAGHIFNEDLKCVYLEPDRLNYATYNDVLQMISSHSQQITTVIASVQGLNCRYDTDTKYISHVLKEYCIESMINGTTMLVKCPEISTDVTSNNLAETTMMTKTIITVTTITTITTINTAKNETNSSKIDQKEIIHYNNSLGTVFFWGAQTYMDTNVAHVVLCIVVVAVYLSVPELGKNIYNRAILRHNLCLLLQGSLLMFLGFCELRNCQINDNFAIFMWIMQQYFTNATVFWLNVICFDMTLSITRFRWIVGSDQRTSQAENRRLLIYGIFAWGGALIPAIVAFILEYSPGIPEDFPLKPNYRRYRGGPNFVVNIYFFSIPLFTLFWNNILFIFTTYKIIRIQRSTKIATRNQTNVLRKKYFLFLQMYLLMGAPWFFGLLFACMNKLVVLKICRLIWPILWLLIPAADKKLREKFVSKLRRIRKKQETTTSS
ncbi:uncharacterized protein LOC109852691 [Pseudomyrmex gracilis]|uniref:uncharacterized protein LOC109852691 n=1 Tax=Pseudomyrmex gracilis TaxID=219809 RepID=UPI000995A706|nr:uncharacterized protein LOC109852691 [Pseudomyrmex gracilis]